MLDDQRLAAIRPGPDHTTLRTFAIWKIHRELAARRTRDQRPDPLAATMPKRWISSAIELTAWLHDHGLTLALLDQPHLDLWLAHGPAGRRHVRRFVAWLERHQSRRGLRVPSRPQGTAVIALADAERLTALRNLLDDDAIDAHLRIAGCLVALYAPARRTDHPPHRWRPAAHRRRRTGPSRHGSRPAPARTAGGRREPARARRRHAADAVAVPRPKGRTTHPSRAPRPPAQTTRRSESPGAQQRARRLAYRIPAPVLAELLGLSAHTTANASTQLKVDYARYVAHRT